MSFLSEEMTVVLARGLASMATEVDERTRDQPELREALHSLAQQLVAATQPATTTGTARGENRTTLKLDQSDSSARPQRRYSDVTDDDLDLIIQRLQLKAEGARWAVERDDRQRDGEDFATQIRPGDQDIIQRAKSIPQCFLWMNQPRSDVWRKADDFLLIADCFDTAADALITLQATITSDCRESFRKAIDLLAEAQSALRVSVSRVEEHPDSDQQMIYHWLRNRAGVERFYIDRYMRITDPADPERCDDVTDECTALRNSLETAVEAPAGTEDETVSLQIPDQIEQKTDNDDSLSEVA